MAFATAAVLYGVASGAALATMVGVLIEVPVMLLLVRICLRSRRWFPGGEIAANMQETVTSEAGYPHVHDRPRGPGPAQVPGRTPGDPVQSRSGRSPGTVPFHSGLRFCMKERTPSTTSGWLMTRSR